MAEERVQRRLAAILAADVVGYSRLMEQDEAGTLAALKARRREVLEPLVARHHGRIFKIAGDGALAEFASAVNAVECAVALQRGMAEQNAGLPDARRIVLRIGINLGDVIVEGGDIYGDGVNAAARLEALAEPGGIHVSGKVHDEVVRKLDLGFDDLGTREVKNMTAPVRLYRVRMERPMAALATLSLPDKPSIAVLAFANPGGDPEQEYFADGIAEDITTALSKWRWFFVTARNSSFAYKGRAVDVKQVGRELGVRYVLEGSVRRSGSRLRIAAQLIDALTGHHVWAEKYDGDLADVFVLQDEITERIARAIDPALRLAETQQAIRRPPLAAWDHYLRGAFALNRYTRNDNEAARRHFMTAIELDANFALAHAQLARTHYYAALMQWDDPGRAMETAHRIAGQAVSLDEMEAVAQQVLAASAVYMHRHDEALVASRRAVELNPNYAGAHGSHGLALNCDGRFAEAYASLGIALRLSPNDARAWTSFVLAGTAVAQYGLRNYEGAARAAREALTILDQNLRACIVLMAALGQLGHREEAERARARLDQLQPGIDPTRVATILPYRDLADLEHFLDGMRKAALRE